MTRLEKIECAIKMGYTYDPHTGKIYGIRGKEITNLNNGYVTISIKIDNKHYALRAHQFGYYCVHKEVVDCIDHINGIKTDNRIINLRSITQQENLFNNPKAKGYTWKKNRNKWMSYINVDGVKKHLGYYINEEDARKAYLEAKEVYHQIG